MLTVSRRRIPGHFRTSPSLGHTGLRGLKFEIPITETKRSGSRSRLPISIAEKLDTYLVQFFLQIKKRTLRTNFSNPAISYRHGRVDQANLREFSGLLAFSAALSHDFNSRTTTHFRCKNGSGGGLLGVGGLRVRALMRSGEQIEFETRDNFTDVTSQ